MPTVSWASTVPDTGALRTSHISKNIFTAAIAECVFMEHVETESFGAGMGESTTLTRISRQTEASDYSLAEMDRIPETQLTVTGKVVTAGEFGKAIPCTNLAKTFATFDINNAIQGELKDQMKLALDSRACRAFKQTLFKYVPTGATSASTATNGTAPTSALANVNIYHMAQIRDLLYDTYKAEPADGTNYIGIFRTLGVRGIQDDAEWQEWQKYTNPEAMYNSEVGKVHQIRVMETNHGGTSVTGLGLNKIGTGDVLGEGVVFGKNAVKYIEALAPEIRPGREDDFGRQHSVCWYGIYEFSILWDTANSGELKVIHVTSVD